MAELLLKSNKSGHSKPAPRIDLTPMVDLGFLLITFFMMTTTMAQPKAMDIQMPSKERDPNPPEYYETSAITLMPAAHHSIYYYEGIFNPDTPLKKVTDISSLRKMLADKELSLQNRQKPAERDIQVIIKSHASSTVQDIVALLDEMRISNIKYYAMVDMDAAESELINQDESSR